MREVMKTLTWGLTACLLSLTTLAFPGSPDPTDTNKQSGPIEKAVASKYRLAEIPFVQGNWAEAAQALDRFVKEYPRSSYTYRAVKNMALALGKLNRHAEARQAFLESIASNPQGRGREYAELKAALCLFRMKDYAAFDGEGRSLLAKYPAHASLDAEWIQLHLAQLPGKRGQWEESARQLEKVIKARPAKTLAEAMIDCGRAWLMAAGKAGREGKKDLAGEHKAKGISHLLQARRELESQLAQGKKSRTNENARVLILETYRLEKNYQGLIQAANLLTAEIRPPSRLWGRGMIYKGVACLDKEPRDLEGAAAAFDAVIAAKMKDANTREHTPSLALYWRLIVAREKRDEAGVQRFLGQLAAMPEGPCKQSALARFKKAP